MERDLPPEPAGNESQQPSATEATDALGQLSADRSRLADRVVTPWWYHPTLGIIVSVFVLAQVLSPPLSISLVALGIIAIPVLTTAYSRRYGISPTTPALNFGRSTGSRHGRSAHHSSRWHLALVGSPCGHRRIRGHGGARPSL